MNDDFPKDNEDNPSDKLTMKGEASKGNLVPFGSKMRNEISNSSSFNNHYQ